MNRRLSTVLGVIVGAALVSLALLLLAVPTPAPAQEASTDLSTFSAVPDPEERAA